MNVWQWTRRWTPAVCAACLLVFAGCREAESHAESATAKPANPAGDPPTFTVAASAAELRNMTVRVPIVGTLLAAEDVTVSTETAGVLTRTFVDVGDIVEPGAPLAQVEVYDYEMTASQARAALAETLARLGVASVPGDDFDLSQVSSVMRAEAQLENARYTQQRLSSIGSAVSGQEINDAAAQVRVAEAEKRSALDEAASLVAQARQRQAQLQLAEHALADTLTDAPPMPTTVGPNAAEHWVVAQRLVTEGQYVSQADQLFRLIIDNPLKLRSNVPERYAPHVRAGQRVELSDLAGAAVMTGTISRVNPAVDQATRTFEIEALIYQNGAVLKPGAFATGAIVADGVGDALCVPASAIATVGGMTRVFVVTDSRVSLRDVRVGRQLVDHVEILSGLSAGEQVVTEGLAKLEDGMAVSVRSAP